MRRPHIVLTFCCAAGIALAAFSVGGGSPTADIQQSFVTAFYRGGFSKLVVAPLENVQALGSPGLVQTFSWAADKTLTSALVDPDPNNTNNTLQMYADLYGYYLTVGGVNIAGYPTNDTATCPANTYGVCDFQLFTNDTALFVYAQSGLPSDGKTYSVADPLYTEWNNGGGVSGPLGVAISAATAVTSITGAMGTQQLFIGGAIYYYTPASATTASAYTVSGQIYGAFANSGGPLTRGAGGIGTLGFPVTEEIILASGQHKQVFENGTVLWAPGSSPDVQLPIQQIQINVSSSLTLPIGGTSTLIATVYDTFGNTVTDRTLSWSTSNGNAVAVQSSGNTATITAVGTGSASIQATVGGQSSTPVYVTVIGQCCAIGAGAPTPAIAQAFEAAVARNNLSVLLPNPTPVVQSGPGYIQTLTAADGSRATWVVSESNTSAVAYVLGGTLYNAYVAAGGYSGPLGYPVSDASPGGTQSFASGAALAGSPVRLVPVPIAAVWIASGAETGPLGAPAGGSSVFTSYSGINGNSQTFVNGTIFGIASGSRAGQAFISTGLILARYLALSGPTGLLGTPISGIFTSGAALQQNFEAGYINLQPGATAAMEHYNPLNPAVTALPATVAPRGTVHISLSGFAFGSNLSVSVAGQSNFTVAAPGGDFEWDNVIPAAATAGTVTIQAKATTSSASASGSYTIVTVAQLRPVLTIVSGNQQAGAPGATLASPLIAALADSSGNPLPGVPVSYSVSPGASANVSAVTDANGQISAALRLQPATGIALLSVSAAGQTLTFGAISAAKTLAGFSAFTQTGPQGALTAALAASMAYLQNTGALAAPNGRATVASVNQYLTANGGFAQSETGTEIANPWAAMQFAGVAGGISIEPANLPNVLDLLNAGSPLVLELSVRIDGAPAGGTAVNAIGINADGTIAIADPNLAFGQTSLSGYLNGFSAQGHTIQASLSGVIAIVPGLTAPAGFVVGSTASSSPSASSPAGACANSINIPDAALAGQSAPTQVGTVTFLECDGTQPNYQLDFATQSGAAILDLNGNPAQTIAAGSALVWQVTRVDGTLIVSPQQMAITEVVNAAGFGPGLSPGEIVSIFGAGLTVGPAIPTVTIKGQPMQVLGATPFQVNAVVPPGTAPGNATLTAKGLLGTITQTVTIVASAPGIFAITNQDGSLNSPVNPAQRSADIVIYGTGLGAAAAQGSLQVVTGTMDVGIGPGAPVKPSFAGLTPGFAGLYQVNVQVPAGTVPGSSVAVTLQEAGQTSNTVAIAVQ